MNENNKLLSRSVRVTVEFRDGSSPVVLDLDRVVISQHRPVTKRYKEGRVVELIPDVVTTTTITGFSEAP